MFDNEKHQSEANPGILAQDLLVGIEPGTW
jgi:hypothetical protein